MESEDVIRKHSISVLFRIALFILVYIGLIALGVFLLWIAYRFAVWGFLHLTAISSIRLILILIGVMIGGIGFSVMFSIYLVKFIFSKTQNVNANRRLVTETECPALFNAIREVASATQCPMPKKVYLSPDVNACVFYDTSFWSIFFPVKKNLEIGLGLFTSTNTSELKGILAHEFGHFSQKSMKIGSSVYITNTVLYNLAFQEDKWDQWVDKWCMLPVQLLAIFGMLTRRFTNLVRKILQNMYKVVNRSYFRLSRQMEYDADAIACSYVGNQVFASALRKIEVLGTTFEITRNGLTDLSEEKKKVSNIFESHQIVTDFITYKNQISLRSQSLMNKDIPSQFPESRIVVENVWDTHPSLSSRISHLPIQSGEISENDLSSSWTLLPDTYKEEISQIIEAQIAENTQTPEDETKTISNEDFMQWYKEYYRKNTIPEEYQTFLQRDIATFDRSLVTIEETENPFSPSNSEIIKEYSIATNDWNTLCSVYNKELEIESISYLGEKCSIDKLPMDKHRTYILSLFEKIKQIDYDIYKYVSYRVMDDVSLKENVNSLYNAIFFVKEFKDQYDIPLTDQINALIAEFNRPINRDEENIKQLKKTVNALEKDIKQTMSMCDWEILSEVTIPETINQLKSFVESPNDESEVSEINIEYVNTMIQSKVIYSYLLDKVDKDTKIKLGNIIDNIVQQTKINVSSC